MDYLSLGQQVRYARKRRSYTQAELAELVGCSVQHISHIENGTTKLSVELMVNLANQLGVSLDDLFCGSLFTSWDDSDLEDVENLFADCSNEERLVLIRLFKLIKMEIVTYTESIRK